MEMDKVLYAALDEDGDIMGSPESVFISETKDGVEDEVAAWKGISWSDRDKYTIEKIIITRA